MSLRKEISPHLEDFKRANGKGSSANANAALTKIIEVMLSHIEQHIPTPSHLAPSPVYTNSHTFTINNVELSAPPLPDDDQYRTHFGCIPPEQTVTLMRFQPEPTVQHAELPEIKLTEMVAPDYVAPAPHKRSGPKPRKLSELKDPRRARKLAHRPE